VVCAGRDNTTLWEAYAMVRLGRPGRERDAARGVRVGGRAGRTTLWEAYTRAAGQGA
jgi:hypothetical protein